MFVVIVDSSAWAAYFKGDKLHVIDAAIGARAVRVPPLQLTELLSHKLDAKQKALFETFFSRLTLCECSREHYQRAAQLKALAESKNINLSARDAHIAQCALDAKAILITRDPLFLELQRFTSLQVVL